MSESSRLLAHKKGNASVTLPLLSDLTPLRLYAWTFLAAVLGFFMSATALAQTDDTARFMKRQVPPQVLGGEARLLGHNDPSQKIRLVLGIKPPHLAEEEQFLVDLQTKGSPEFHHFLTAEEWDARFAPSAEDEQKVVDWAKSEGLTVASRYPDRLIVDVEGTSGQIERIFGVRINQYQVGSEIEYSNDRDPVVPESVSSIMSGVVGMNSIQRMHSSMKSAKPARGPNYAEGPIYRVGETGAQDGDYSYNPENEISMTPKITNGFYDPSNIFSSEAYNYAALHNLGHCCNPNANPGTSPPESSIAIAAWGVFDPNDLKGFHDTYPALAYHYSIFYIAGPTACCSDEATLDVEWSTATSNSFGAASNTAHVYMYVGANTLFTTFVTMYNKMISDNFARVMSTSWGGAEVYGWPVAGINIVHPIFNKMAGQGWSLVAASGDAGAADDCKHKSIDYPASDPNFVAAGGTTLGLDGAGNYVSEVGWQGGTTSGSCATNHGGSGGGVSVVFSEPSYQSPIGGSRRHTPDMALNANAGQNYYFNGGLHGVGGTSIVAPELAGFFAQENAYLLAVGDIIGKHCGGGVDIACSPMGNPNYMLYTEGFNHNYADHYPFYDITKDCNSNDITALYGLTFYCAKSGYDLVTGLGSANMLQLAWTINTYLAWDGGAPKATFTGPTTHVWYKTTKVVDWTLADTTATSYPKNGVAGYTAAWDKDPGDVFSEPTPGKGNSYYSGPAHAASSGSATLSSQGCHTVHLRAWDNAGTASGDQTYGPVCYDSLAPSASISVGSPASNGSVAFTLTASDPGFSAGTGSGIAKIYYSVDGSACTTSATGSCKVYSSSVTLSTSGSHVVRYFSEDKAGNFSTEHSDTITVK